MSEKMKGHGKQYKPPVFEKLASSTLITLTSETQSYHFYLSHKKLAGVKIMTLIDKRRQAFRSQDADDFITRNSNQSLIIYQSLIV